MSTFILILFIATSQHPRSGAAGIAQQFNDEKACLLAGRALSLDAKTRGNYVLTWGCFPKGGAA